MNTKFKTFFSTTASTAAAKSATDKLNDWLASNPQVTIIDWQTAALGLYGTLYITIRYTED